MVIAMYFYDNQNGKIFASIDTNVVNDSSEESTELSNRELPCENMNEFPGSQTLSKNVGIY